MALSVFQRQKREIFFNNLLLLDFDVYAIEKKHRVKLHKDMFAVTNKKGFEVVTYLLFSKLSEVTNQDYSIIWPLLDKEQERRFQKKCFTFLTSFAQDSNVRFPTVLQSILTTYSGDRFYDLYFSFSCYVVEKAIIKSHVFDPKNGNATLLSRPSVNECSKDAFKTVQLCTNVCFEEFKNITETYNSNMRSWLERAKMLSAHLEKLKSSLSTNQITLQKQTQTLASIYEKDILAENLINDILEEDMAYYNKVQNSWNVLEKFIDREKELWSCISSELDTNEKPLLDGSKYKICVPNFICKEVSDTQKISLLNTEESEKMSVSRFLQLFIILLEFLSEVFQKGNFSNIQGISSLDVSNMKCSLGDLKTLNSKLSQDVLPSTVKHIETLETSHSFHIANVSNELEDMYKEFLFQETAISSETFEENKLFPETYRLLNPPSKSLTLSNCPKPFYKDEQGDSNHSECLNQGENFSLDKNVCSFNPEVFGGILETSILSPIGELNLTCNQSLEEKKSSLPEDKLHLNRNQICSRVSSGRLSRTSLGTEGSETNESWQAEDSFCLDAMTLSDVSLVD